MEEGGRAGTVEVRTCHLDRKIQIELALPTPEVTGKENDGQQTTKSHCGRARE